MDQLLFTYSFTKLLSMSSYVPGTVLDSEDAKVKDTVSAFLEFTI